MTVRDEILKLFMTYQMLTPHLLHRKQTIHRKLATLNYFECILNVFATGKYMDTTPYQRMGKYF